MTDRARSIRAVGPHYYTLRPDSDIGGEVYERMLLERLPGHGVEVVLGLPRDHALPAVPGGWTVDTLRHRLGVHWVAAPAVFTPWVWRALRDGGVDLLRAHSVRHAGPSVLLARALRAVGGRVSRRDGGRAGRPARVPVVVHHHHSTPRWHRLETSILKRADAVITVSEHSRTGLIAAGVPAERVHVVYDGVARPPATDGWDAAWPGGDAALRLLSLGRLEVRKRPDLAIEALSVLREAHGIDATLVIAGEGPMLTSLVARTAARGLSDHVRFVGRVTEEQKWRLYDSAQVFLFGSTLEGFGLVVAEAQSRGVPVVAAAGTATSEVLRDGESGLLAAPDPGEFAAAVASLADPSRRVAFGAAARTFAARFDWDRCAAEVADVYRRIVAAVP